MANYNPHHRNHGNGCKDLLCAMLLRACTDAQQDLTERKVRLNAIDWLTGMVDMQDNPFSCRVVCEWLDLDYCKFYSIGKEARKIYFPDACEEFALFDL